MESADFAAGYYQSMTYIGIVILLSIVYQTRQISKYISRTKWPLVPDLPYKREKSGRIEAEIDNQPREAVTIVPDVSNIHSAPTVYLHKFINYTVSLITIGDMSIGEILLFVFFIVINVTFLLLPFSADASGAETLSKRCAYLALANAAFVFPLATRNSVFLKLIGVPFERLIRFHRWVGRTIYFLLTFHASFQIQQSYNNSVYEALFGTPTNKWGFLAYLSILIIILTSHSVIHEFIMFLGVGLGLYIVDRFTRFILGIGSINVIGMESIQSGVTRIIFEFKDYYEPGQYMFINFSNLKPPVSWIAWHPISFSSAPSIMDDGVHFASIHMKVQGGFSKNLYMKAQGGAEHTRVPLNLRIDGPYGKPSIDFMQYRTVALICGGIGITPMISILRDLVDRQVGGMPIVTQAIYFMWVIPDIDSYQWFGSDLRELMARAETLPENKYLLDIKIFLTRSTTTPSSMFFQGRPDFSVLMQDIKQYHGSGDIAVGVCGPGIMLKQVRNAAIKASDETCLFKVHCSK
ncbi:10792_t:CDS:2 [Funneliformis geosporum]|nr:10792_t:CDS:2 [Funneliformis geosporum]